MNSKIFVDVIIHKDFLKWLNSSISLYILSPLLTSRLANSEDSTVPMDVGNEEEDENEPPTELSFSSSVEDILGVRSGRAKKGVAVDSGSLFAPTLKSDNNNVIDDVGSHTKNNRYRSNGGMDVGVSGSLAPQATATTSRSRKLTGKRETKEVLSVGVEEGDTEPVEGLANDKKGVIRARRSSLSRQDISNGSSNRDAPKTANKTDNSDKVDIQATSVDPVTVENQSKSIRNSHRSIKTSSVPAPTICEMEELDTGNRRSSRRLSGEENGSQNRETAQNSDSRQNRDSAQNRGEISRGSGSVSRNGSGDRKKSGK